LFHPSRGKKSRQPIQSAFTGRKCMKCKFPKPKTCRAQGFAGRDVVDFLVDESLKYYLKETLQDDCDEKLNQLF